MNATPTPKPIVQPQTSRHATLQRVGHDDLLVIHPRRIFDSIKVSSLSFEASGNRSVGFDILLLKVRIVTLFFGGFFYARSFSSLHGGLGGGASAHRFLWRGLLTPFNLPPVFRSSDGRNLSIGAFL